MMNSTASSTEVVSCTILVFLSAKGQSKQCQQKTTLKRRRGSFKIYILVVELHFTIRNTMFSSLSSCWMPFYGRTLP